MPSSPSFLDDLQIASPCKADWAQMQGDERVRFCGRCEKYVYNLSEMSREESVALLLEKGEACVRMARRADGTVVTNDCPVGARSQRRTVRVATALAGGLLAASALVLRHRAYADQPKAQTHAAELSAKPSCASPKPASGPSLWDKLSELAKTAEPLPEPMVMGGVHFEESTRRR
jgi:hypothetical protein